MPASRLTVKVWCLPRQTEAKLKSLHQVLVEAVAKLNLGVKGEDDMIVLFPSDMMAYGLGSEILVEVSHLPYLRYAPDYADYNSLKSHLAGSVKAVLQRRFPRAHIQGSFLWVEDFPE